MAGTPKSSDEYLAALSVDRQEDQTGIVPGSAVNAPGCADTVRVDAMSTIGWLVGGLLLTGCAAVPLSSGAELVRLSTSEPASDCTFLGETAAPQGDYLGGYYVSEVDLDPDTRAELVNRAAAMGGNVLTNLTNRGGHTATLESDHQLNVTIAGRVYYCPQ